MPTARRKLHREAKGFYDIVVAAKGQETLEEIARRIGIRTPLLTHHVVQYALKNNLPILEYLSVVPKNRQKPVVPKTVKRNKGTGDVRVSTLRLQDAGMADLEQVKVIPGPDAKAVLIVAPDVAAASFDEALALMGYMKTADEAKATPKLAPVQDLGAKRRGKGRTM